MMQQKIATHTHTHTHTHKDSHKDSHTVTPHLNNLPHSCCSISCSDKNRTDRSRQEEKKKGERESAAVMICDAFTTATCSSLVYQTQTHTDEPRLQTVSIWEGKALYCKYIWLQSSRCHHRSGLNRWCFDSPPSGSDFIHTRHSFTQSPAAATFFSPVFAFCYSCEGMTT